MNNCIIGDSPKDTSTPPAHTELAALREAVRRTLMPDACVELYSRLLSALLDVDSPVEAWAAEYALSAILEEHEPVYRSPDPGRFAMAERNRKRWGISAKQALRRRDPVAALIAVRQWEMWDRPSPSTRLIRGKALHSAGFPGAALHVLLSLMSEGKKAELAQDQIECILLDRSPVDAAPAAAMIVKRCPQNQLFAALAARSEVPPHVGAAAVASLEAAVTQLDRSWPLMALAQIYRLNSDTAAETASLERAAAILPASAGRELTAVAARLDDLGRTETAGRALMRAMTGKQNVAARRPLAKRLRQTPHNGGSIADLPLVLISQVQRSGGTLLSQLFDGHPEVFSHPHEIQIGQPEKWHWPRIDLSDSPEQWLETLLEPRLAKFAQHGYRKSDGNVLSSSVLPFDVDVERLGERFFGLLADRPPQRARDVIAAYFTAYFDSWPSYRSSGRERWFCGFVPRMIGISGSVTAFRETYPDGLFVSCIRSPLSWYASAQRHYSEYASVAHAIELWKTSTLSSINLFLRDPTAIHLLTYDDLVTKPETEMRRLAARLGITFAPCLLSPTYLGTPIQPNSSYAIADAMIHTKSLNSGALLVDSDRAYIEREAVPLYRDALSLIAESPQAK